jgi:RTX calcium-binding nonapeptide repeat (4 copies)
MSGSSGIGTHSVARDTSTFLSAADDQDISGLLVGIAWNGTTITYSFPTASAQYGSQTTYGNAAPFTGFSQLDSAGHSGQQAEVHRALDLIASYTNLTFVQITETTTTHATIRLANSATPSTSFAFFPTTGARGGDVFYGGTGDNPVMGNFDSGQATLHEIGHALGLDHGQLDPGIDLDTYGGMNADRLDIEFSLMNYANWIGQPTHAGATASTSAETYMMYDIAALQYMYGANFNQAGQNNTFTWSATTGTEFVNGVSQGTPYNGHIFETVWTAGANSTYDLSNFSQNQVDDMNPGGWMVFSTSQLADLDLTSSDPARIARADIYNALEYNGDPRSLIDNIITGSGADTITGNSANNTIRAGLGNDTIDGGHGTDTAIFSGSLSAYTLTDLGGGSVRVSGPDGTDTLTSVERLQFDDQTVTWATNHAPVLTIPSASVTASAGQTFSMANLFTATDADGDAIKYYFQDGGLAANSGHFVVNGSVIANGTAFSLTAAQLAQTTFVAGAAGTSDDLYVQLSDGTDVSSLGFIHLSVPNHAPVLTISPNVTANAGQTLSMASLFTATDADGDAIKYYFHDNGLAANSGHFVVNGLVIADGTDFSLTAAQLAQASFVAGAQGTSDDLYVQLSDGKADSSLSVVHVSVPTNRAPVLTITSPNVTGITGEAFFMSELFTATDPDGDAIKYYFHDGGTAANSGHFFVNGAMIADGADFSLTAAQAQQAFFIAGARGTSDDLYVQLSDGKAVSSLGIVHVSVPDHAPVLTIPSTNVSAGTGQTSAMSDRFNASDPDGDAIKYYFHDNGLAANSGHFVVNGAVIADGTDFSLTAAQLAQTTFVAGASGTSDDLYVQLSDGAAVSSLGVIHVSVPANHAPVLAIPSANVTAAGSQTFSMSDLFSATDADGDSLRFYFHDNSLTANSGHFVVNGSVVADGTDFSITSAQLAQTNFVAGATGTSDDLYVQLSDGKDVSSLGVVHVSAINHAPVLTPVADYTVGPGQAFLMATLFSATDADGDSLRYYFHDAGLAPNSGHFIVNGTVVPDGTDFSVTTLAGTTFVAGAAGTSDDLYAQLSDGKDVSSLGVVHISVAVAAGAQQADSSTAGGANLVFPTDHATIDPMSLFGTHMAGHIDHFVV